MQQKNFSDFGKTKLPPKEICQLFALSFQVERLEFPTDLPGSYLPEIKTLEQKTEKKLKKFALSNEIGKRDFLIAPVFSLLFDWVEFELSTEKFINLEDGLKGSIDYLIKAKNEILVVEAKNDDFDGGANQIIAELFAMSKLENRDRLFGVVTNGRFWQFYQFQVEKKLIIQDLDFYSFPAHSVTLFAVLYFLLSV